MRRGSFQSDPILETLRIYYSSSGIMEPIPHEDPGVGNRPLGILTLVAATVCLPFSYKIVTLMILHARLNVHTKCTSPGISFPLPSGSIAIPGAQQPHNS